MIAAIDIAYSGVYKTFTTRNLHQKDKMIDIRPLDGPFSYLQGFLALQRLGERRTGGWASPARGGEGEGRGLPHLARSRVRGREPARRRRCSRRCFRGSRTGSWTASTSARCSSTASAREVAMLRIEVAWAAPHTQHVIGLRSARRHDRGAGDPPLRTGRALSGNRFEKHGVGRSRHPLPPPLHRSPATLVHSCTSEFSAIGRSR